jgi:mRNA-degrading endonuclease RelE of RelBE toxin-antitoxin system
MYRVFLERAAEKDLKQLSAKLHNRVIVAIQRSPGILALPGAKNSRRRITIGGLEWATIGDL